MKEYICKEVPTDNGGYLEPVSELIRCKDCKYARMTTDGKAQYCEMWDDDDGFSLELYLDGDFYCAWAERR